MARRRLAEYMLVFVEDGGSFAEVYMPEMVALLEMTVCAVFKAGKDIGGLAFHQEVHCNDC